MVPHRLEALGLAERRLGGVVVCEVEQAVAIVRVPHQGLKGLCEAVGRRAAVGDHVLRYEMRDRLIGHPADDGVHHARFVAAVRVLRQEADEEIRRELADG